MPNWRFDTLCVEPALAAELAGRFRVDLRRVDWPRPTKSEAMQLVVPTTRWPWFNPEELRQRVSARHGHGGARCVVCGIWRWLPLPFGSARESLPAVHPGPDWGDHDAIASPEWFGDGSSSHREILVRRELGELIANASPRDMAVRDVQFTTSLTREPAKPAAITRSTSLPGDEEILSLPEAAERYGFTPDELTSIIDADELGVIHKPGWHPWVREADVRAWREQHPRPRRRMFGR